MSLVSGRKPTWTHEGTQAKMWWTCTQKGPDLESRPFCFEGTLLTTAPPATSKPTYYYILHTYFVFTTNLRPMGNLNVFKARWRTHNTWEDTMNSETHGTVRERWERAVFMTSCPPHTRTHTYAYIHVPQIAAGTTTSLFLYISVSPFLV